jgi:alcohol dehydrogenase
MKAAQINEYGDPSIITIVDVEKPIAREGQVLVEVHASSLNPVDSAIRSGRVKEMMPLQFPATLGGDFAGIVTEVGAGVTSATVGDRVYGQSNAAFGNSGAFAEYTATAAAQTAKAPENVSFKDAASLPLVGVSALQALTTHINLAPNQKILINGGSGGIGTLAIQIAKHIGAYVATTATGEGITLAKQLGADEVIDYKMQDMAKVTKDFDAVFDTVGGSSLDHVLPALKDGGVVVSMVAQPNEALIAGRDITAIMQMTQVTTEALQKLATLVESGAVKPQVGKVYTLDEIANAFVARESGSIAGKVVIEIVSPS